MKTETLALQPTIIKDLVKESVTEMLAKSVDDRGLPIFGVIEIENEHGEIVLAYKQEKLFNAEDYRRAALYQNRLADNHRILADYYEAELQKLEEKSSSANGAF
jgi:hypothetical protein